MTKPVTFVKEVQVELSKVVWPTRKQVIKLTLIVIGASIAVGVFIGGLDYIFTKIMAIALKG
ncbi:preprotein translocase subunit SecE [Candidatus Microgenomates bacterium]|nr:preprotein translocase subunit SecE [Candidatus Microgenomates bacterium]